MVNKKNHIKIENITLVGQSTKKQMLRVINEGDYKAIHSPSLGKLFGILDLSLGQAQNSKLFEIINEGITRYYKNDLEFDIAYDDMVNFLNRRSGQFLPEKNLQTSANIILGALKGNKILFSPSGGVYAYLIYNGGVKKIYPEEGEKVLDVSNKLFSYSLNGEISKTSAIYFCNEAFNQKVNPYNLGKFIKQHGASPVIADLKDWLLKKDDSNQYNALFIHYDKEDEAQEGSRRVEDLFRSTRETDQNISPSLLNSITGAVKEKSILGYIIKYSLFGVKKFLMAIKKTILFIAFLVFNSFFIITNLRGKRRERQLIVNSRFKKIWFAISDFYKSLTAISKAILIGIIALALILTGSVSYGLYLQKIKDLKKQHQVKILSAQQLYDEADAGLLFQEKNIAVKKLKNALVILDAIPEKIQDEKYNKLYTQIKNRLYEVQNIKEVTSPVILADFSMEENFMAYPPLYLKNGKLHFLTQNQAISVNTLGQDIKRNNFVIKGLGNNLYFYENDKGLVYSIENQDTLQVSSPSKSEGEIKKIASGNNSSIEKFAIFNERMYSIGTKEKYFSIWKHSPSLTGFGKPTLWATDNLPQGAKPISLAIDGNIYILFNGNQIYKYYRGNKAQWSYDSEGLDKGVEFKKLITNEQMKNIYILAQNRISIISKDGDFLGHYILPTISNPKDIAVDENANIIYILTDKKVYTFKYQL